ncbi:hypothetical protein BB559_002462 [Furculomyces boomerangus]|uniref:Uncharacterized protein n=2 Tax=Harpellales TaxID=61421 RepID=A0A2T9YV79_9FUNG|nr:hypothetical protein BB559_002462 [Furculomyces boomerangus]PVZ98650.1 hypothetical protein BB558_005359 [Smittium angustum]
MNPDSNQNMEMVLHSPRKFDSEQQTGLIHIPNSNSIQRNHTVLVPTPHINHRYYSRINPKFELHQTSDYSSHPSSKSRVLLDPYAQTNSSNFKKGSFQTNPHLGHNKTSDSGTHTSSKSRILLDPYAQNNNNYNQNNSSKTSSRFNLESGTQTRQKYFYHVIPKPDTYSSSQYGHKHKPKSSSYDYPPPQPPIMPIPRPPIDSNRYRQINTYFERFTNHDDFDCLDCDFIITDCTEN